MSITVADRSLRPASRAAAPASGRGTPLWLIGTAILALSVSYALALFTGQEWHSGYTGTTYKALHPESFPHDPYMTDASPMRRSSYFWLVRAVGDLWLDDRLAIALFFGLVGLALIGVDKTAQCLGATRVEERLFVLGLMAFGHRFRDNYGHIVTNADFYAGTFAGVAIVWLIALALSSAKFWKLVVLCAALWSLTAKWAWLPTLIVLTLLWQERLDRRQRHVAIWLALVGALGLYGVYWLWLRPPGEEHILLFDYLNRVEGSEGNPFLDAMPLANPLYFLMLGLGWGITPPGPIQRRRARTVVVIGAVLWLVGGLYLTYTPDALKIPYVIPLAFNGATQWPQYVLFLTISAGALMRLRERSWGVRTLALATMLGGLYGTFAPARMMKFCLMTFAAAGAWWLLRRRDSAAGRIMPAWSRALVGVLAAAAVGSTLFAYTRGAIRRAADLGFLARHGVMGGHPSAKWVGVNEYIRTHTPPDAVILPIVRGAYRGQTALALDKWLQTRTGRAVPVGVPFSVWFDYAALLELDEKFHHMGRLVAAVAVADARALNEELTYFNAESLPVDYLVLERADATRLEGQIAGYRAIATAAAFTVLQRVDGPRAGRGGRHGT